MAKRRKEEGKNYLIGDQTELLCSVKFLLTGIQCHSVTICDEEEGAVAWHGRHDEKHEKEAEEESEKAFSLPILTRPLPHYSVREGVSGGGEKEKAGRDSPIICGRGRLSCPDLTEL